MTHTILQIPHGYVKPEYDNVLPIGEVSVEKAWPVKPDVDCSEPQAAFHNALDDHDLRYARPRSRANIFSASCEAQNDIKGCAWQC